MKTKIGILVLALCTIYFNVQAQRRMVTTTRATSNEISDNLDLDAVASIFGDSENLEDFERRLNDPDTRISNLDLNQDGYIDYLRVLENSSDRNSLVVIQAVLDEDVFQDVATIEIERTSNSNHRIQIVGDSYIYGSNYIIEPVFYRTPLIFSFFWGPRYSPWQSPYYWNYYPRWYSYYRPCSPFKYRRNVYAHINYENKYHRGHDRNIHFSGDNYNRIRRNDFANRHPERAFESRHQGISNRNELNNRRPDNQVGRQRGNDVQRSNDNQYQYNKNANSGRGERQGNVNEGRRPSNVQSGTNHSRPRESNNIEQNQRRSYPSSGSELKKADSNREPIQRRSVSRSNQTSNPERSAPRVESNKKSSVSSGRSNSESNRGRSNSNARPAQQSEKKSESTKSESKKDSHERRRTE